MVYLYRQTKGTEESKKYIWKELEQFKILTIQTENGEIKTEDQTRRKLSKNGEVCTQTERKPTVFVILDCRSRQYIVGGERINIMKTTKQIADELGIDKQRVYRYIKKNHISEALQKNGVMYYDDVAETNIKQAFDDKSVSNEVHQKHINEAVIDTLLKQSEMLQKELEMKNKQIEKLNEMLAESYKILNQEQQLHAMAKQELKLLEVKVEEQEQTKEQQKKWWKFWE